MHSRLTYANVVATLALVFSMTGGAIAANRYLINSTRQISPKVLGKLRGASGPRGPAGREGTPGREGPAGKEGREGREGPRGLGLVASGGTSAAESCELTGTVYCFPKASTSFTPAVDAQCLVRVSSQVEGLAPGKPSTDGPYFRIAIKEGAAERNDGEHGYYFEGSDGGYSAPQERTRLLSVKAATTYTFGVYYAEVGGEWVNTKAPYEMTYTCYA